MNRIARWLINRAKRTPYSHIYDPASGDLYMERYWLVPFATEGSAANVGCYRAKWHRHPLVWLLQRFGIAVRVHRIMREDRDRHMHDHPWSFVSLVLDGWYLETQPSMPATKLRAAGGLAFRSYKCRHRISMVPVGGVWTLFITGPKRQSWGFFTERGKVPWHVYLAEQEAQQ